MSRLVSIKTERIFWSRVRKGSGCWICVSWQAHGRPMIPLGQGKREAAHRISWKIHFGRIPRGSHYWRGKKVSYSICHKCDNPICVRPSHLFVGTMSDNIKDMHRKGRANQLRVRRYKLERLIPKILRLREQGCSGQQIATLCVVGKTSVNRVLREIA